MMDPVHCDSQVRNHKRDIMKTNNEDGLNNHDEKEKSIVISILLLIVSVLGLPSHRRTIHVSFVSFMKTNSSL